MNQTIVNYLKENEGKFSKKVLKDALLGQGYSATEIDEAMNASSSKTSATSTPPKPSSGNALVDFLNSVFNGLKVPADEHPFYVEAMRLGAIGDVLSTAITMAANYLAWNVFFDIFLNSFGGAMGLLNYSLGSSFGYGFGYGYDISATSIIYSLILAIIYGSVGIFIFIRYIAKYWPKFLGRTLFAKMFYFNLVITVIFGGLIGIIASLAFPPILLSFLITLVGGIIASYAFAKTVASGLEKKYPDILNRLMQ